MNQRHISLIRIYPVIVAIFLLISACGEDKKVVPDHAFVPGVVIDHSPASSGEYIGSPSIVVLPNGNYIASHDYFGPQSLNNTSCIHKSVNKGQNWDKVIELKNQFWSSLFWYNGAIYILGTTQRRGEIVVRRSDDEGQTWTEPSTDAGLLFSDSKYHCAPVPVVIHNQRIWRAFEDYSGKWGISFQPVVISAPFNVDLLFPENWTTSNKLSWGEWPPYNGWLEGNIVVKKDGSLANVLRVVETEKGGKAAIVQISDDGKLLEFDPRAGFIDFPGGSKKFTIRFDQKSGKYWSLTNWIHPDDAGKWNASRTRNTVALVSSHNLEDWVVNSVILRSDDYEKTGFQYLDWQYEGNDMVAVSRTAFDDGLGGAHNAHDANYMTFHRIINFRSFQDKTVD